MVASRSCSPRTSQADGESTCGSALEERLDLRPQVLSVDGCVTRGHRFALCEANPSVARAVLQVAVNLTKFANMLGYQRFCVRCCARTDGRRTEGTQSAATTGQLPVGVRTGNALNAKFLFAPVRDGGAAEAVDEDCNLRPRSEPISDSLPQRREFFVDRAFDDEWRHGVPGDPAGPTARLGV